MCHCHPNNEEIPDEKLSSYLIELIRELRSQDSGTMWVPKRDKLFQGEMEDTSSVPYGRAHVTGAGLETRGEEVATILRNCPNPVWPVCQSPIVRYPTKGHSYSFTSSYPWISTKCSQKELRLEQVHGRELTGVEVRYKTPGTLPWSPSFKLRGGWGAERLLPQA